jgi:hypothetical protein
MQRRTGRIGLAAGLVVALTTLASPTAQAKGAESVTIAGPGIGTVQLTYTSAPDDTDLNDVVNSTRINDIYDSANAASLGKRPTGDLGPRYVVTYIFGDVAITQEAYPLAEDGPVVYFPPDQALWGLPVAAGWNAAPSELRTVLAELGAPAVRRPPAPAKAPPDVNLAAAADAPSGNAGDEDPWSRWWLAALAGACGLGILGGFGLERARRRT